MRPGAAADSAIAGPRARGSWRAALAFALVALAGCDFMAHPRDKAAQALSRGNLESARIEAHNALQKDETDAEAYVLLARIAFAQSDLSTADRALAKVTKLGAGGPELDELRARVLSKARAYRRILDEVVLADAHQGTVRGVMLAARGQALLAARKPEAARSAFDAALAAAPGLPEARLGHARLAYLEGKREHALQLLERLNTESPANAAAWSLKGELLQLAGDLDAALAAHERAAKADPSDPLPRLAAAELLIRSRRLDEARSHVHAARELAPRSPHVQQMQALLHFREGKHAEALAVTQEILSKSPTFAPAAVLNALGHLARGESKQAESRLRQLVQDWPNHFFARKLYASTLLQRGDARAALDALEPALHAGTSDPQLFTLAAQAHARLKEYARATDYYQQAAKIDPGNPNLQVAAAMTQIVSGEPLQGIALLEEAAGASPDGLSAEIALALVHLERRETQKALAAAQRVQARAPDNPIGFNLAGVAHEQGKDTSAARASFERAVAADPAYWPAVYNLVRAELAAGRAAVAQGRIERFLARERSHVRAIAALLEVTGDRGRFTRLLEDARAADPRALAPRIALARSYLARGLAQEAVVLAQELRAIAPEHPESIELLGLAKLAGGHGSEALTLFKDLVARMPGSIRAQIRLAQAYASLADVRAAESAYRKALEIEPQNVDATLGLARLYAGSGRLDEALALAEALRRTSPESALGYALAGDVLRAAGRNADAAGAYEAAVALAPAGALLVKRHAARVAAGRSPGDGTLIEWLERHPADQDVRMYLANRRYLDGRYDEAIEHYERIVRLDPLHAAALNNLASAYLKKKDRRALQLAERAHRLQPYDGRILDTLGIAQLQAGQTEAAAETLKKALARRPDAADSRLQYALALARLGQRKEARAEVERVRARGAAVALDPELEALLGD